MWMKWNKRPLSRDLMAKSPSLCLLEKCYIFHLKSYHTNDKSLLIQFMNVTTSNIPQMTHISWIRLLVISHKQTTSWMWLLVTCHKKPGKKWLWLLIISYKRPIYTYMIRSHINKIFGSGFIIFSFIYLRYDICLVYVFILLFSAAPFTHGILDMKAGAHFKPYNTVPYEPLPSALT